MFGFDNSDNEKFDRDFERAQRAVVVMWIVSIVLSLAALGGAIYLLVRILSFFGIL